MRFLAQYFPGLLRRIGVQKHQRLILYFYAAECKGRGGVNIGVIVDDQYLPYVLVCI
ncbi:hypothetical protein D3C81_2281750 [compost metagenome]